MRNKSTLSRVLCLLSWSLVLAHASVSTATAQDVAPFTLRFRSGAWHPPAASAPVVSFDGPRHEILQFDDAIDRARVESLAALGVRPLRFIPDNAVLVGISGGVDVSSIAGLRWRGALPPAAKISVETRAWMRSSPAQASLQVITMHADVARTDAEALVAAVGGVVEEQASLGASVLLARVTREAVARLADADAVAWIIPANEAMAERGAGRWCTTMESVAGLFVAEYAVRGEGWEGLGRGQVALSYFMGNDPSSVAGAWDEVHRAMAEWSRHAAVKFTQAGSRRLVQSIDIDWLPARHAEVTNSWTGNNDPDFSPNVLAHAFYPDAPEPYAGDVHFNDELFRWHIGGPTFEGSGNVFDVALHELGHSLGLAHSSDPNAVMYAYLGGRTFAGLTADDIAAIQTIYNVAPYCEMDVLPSVRHVGHEGGRVTFDIVAGPGCAWAVHGVRTWMANEGLARGLGSATAIVAIGRNTTTTPREAELRIADRTVTITQDAMPCIVTAAQSSFVVNAQQDWDFSLSVTSSYWCTWHAVPTVPWITVISEDNGSARLRFATNLSLVARRGSVRMGESEVLFEQRASPDDDGDGLPDTWERRFGLDPSVADASGDADGDGISNAGELAAGTHPKGVVSRYFAEGATSTPFSTRFAFVNPDTTPASVLLQFQRTAGPPLSHYLEVPPLRRATVHARDIPGLEQAEFSTRIESQVAVVVDRTLTWDATGYGSHGETSIVAPATTWFFAEGATHSGFQLFYLLQNPGNAPITVAVTYLRPAPAPPIVKTYALPPNSRTNIWVNAESADLASTDVSATLTSAAPFIAERAMYRDAGGKAFGAGHAAAGVRAPSTHWFFAEGATGPYLDTFLLIANPSAEQAEVRVSYLRPGGVSTEIPYSIAPQSRFNIWVDYEDSSLADTAVSMVVTSQNGVGVVAERAMWWPDGAWHEAHVSPGTTETGTVWAVAEGEVGGPRNAKSYVLVANPTDRYANIRIDRLYEDSQTTEYVFSIPPNSRYNIDTTGGDASIARPFGMLIESIDGSPIVVERAMYSDAGGVTWAAGSGSVATKIR